MQLFDYWQFNLGLYYFFVVLLFHSYKLAVKNAKKDAAATIVFQLMGGLTAILWIPFFAWELPSSGRTYLLLIAAIVFYAITDRLQTTARKHLAVSSYAIISQLLTVFLIIYGIIVFGESFSTSKLAGTSLIIVANVWLFYKPKHERKKGNNYHLVAVAAVLAVATAVTIDVGISDQFNLPAYISIAFLLPAVLVAAFERVSLKEISSEWRGKSRKYYLLAGASAGLATMFSLRSFQLGDLSTIVPLQAVAVILNVIAAYIFLKERDAPFKKLLAASVVVVGVYFTVQ